MWAWLFIAIGAFAVLMTWAFAVREQAVIFTTSMATLSWGLLALQPEIVVIDGGEHAIELSATRWLLAAMAILSLIALFLSVTGAYPEEHPETDFSPPTRH